VIGALICKEIKENQAAVFQRLDELMKEFKVGGRNLQKATLRDVRDQVLTPLRESCEDVMKKWATLEPRIQKVCIRIDLPWRRISY